jgi:hypothetical protein
LPMRATNTLPNTRELERTCLYREQIYGATSLDVRLRGVASAVRNHVYVSRTRGGFGARAFVRDAAMSVALSLPS